MPFFFSYVITKPNEPSTILGRGSGVLMNGATHDFSVLQEQAKDVALKQFLNEKGFFTEIAVEPLFVHLIALNRI